MVGLPNIIAKHEVYDKREAITLVSHHEMQDGAHII